MRLILDTALTDCILEQWDKGTSEFDPIYHHPVFQELLAHAEDFQKREIGAEQYLNELLHIGNMDLQQHRDEIVRNLKFVKRLDLSAFAKEVEAFLPKDACERMGDIYVYPMLGMGGLSLGNKIVFDPSPCPWYPADGSDEEKYLTDFIYALFRHEPHHTGCRQIRPIPTLSELHNLGDLAASMAQHMQLEGGATLCEKQCQARTLADTELECGAHELKQCYEVIQAWLRKADDEISKEDWDYYYTLWGEKQLSYRLGEFIILLLIQCGDVKSVADCMVMEPLDLLKMAYTAINEKCLENRK